MWQLALLMPFFFCRQFAAYLNAGVDYNKTFSSLETQFARTALGPALRRMRQSIKAGSTLEEAMSQANVPVP